MRATPTAAASSAALQRVVVVAADEHDLLVAARRSTPACVPKPACSAVIADAPGMCASSNCSVGAHVDDQRAVGASLLDLARRQRLRVDAPPLTAGRG